MDVICRRQREHGHMQVFVYVWVHSWVGGWPEGVCACECVCVCMCLYYNTNILHLETPPALQ